jgi:hypothetical protein
VWHKSGILIAKFSAERDSGLMQFVLEEETDTEPPKVNHRIKEQS